MSDKPDVRPFYEVPADAVSWSTATNDLALPTDPIRVAQLQAKLVEYKQRLERDCHGDDMFSVWDSICKIAVLDMLLTDGQINLNAVRKKLAHEHGEAVGRVRVAFEVIADYCKTGGQNLYNGTGLINPATLARN